MTTLTGPERPAASGRADSLVVFLHGYGADGNDLIGLAEPLAPHLPNTRFLAPNAPERCPGNPLGYQWFPIPWLDGSSEALARVSAERSFALLDRLARRSFATGDRARADRPRRLQPGDDDGAPRRPAPQGAAGGDRRLLRPAARARAPAGRDRRAPCRCCSIHGDQDPVVPFESLQEAADALAGAGVETYTHVSPGVAHGIAPDGLGVALGFIRDRLGLGDAR